MFGGDVVGLIAFCSRVLFGPGIKYLCNAGQVTPSLLSLVRRIPEEMKMKCNIEKITHLFFTYPRPSYIKNLKYLYITPSIGKHPNYSLLRYLYYDPKI